MTGNLVIDAENEGKAIEIAKGPNTALPKPSYYLEDSFVVDEVEEEEVSD